MKCKQAKNNWTKSPNAHLVLVQFSLGVLYEIHYDPPPLSTRPIARKSVQFSYDASWITRLFSSDRNRLQYG
jgi:hypothetical protein